MSLNFTTKIIYISRLIITGLLFLFFTSVSAQWVELGGANTSTFNGLNSKFVTTDSLGNIFTGGDFTNSNGNYYVAKWDGAGWTELGGNNSSTLNGNITSVQTDLSGKIYISGNFNFPNGNCCIVKWEGNRWKEIGDSTSKNLMILDNSAGKIYAADITISGTGASSVIETILEKDSTGWITEGTNYPFNDYLSCIMVDATHNLYTAGVFANNANSQYVAKYNSASNSWTELGGSNNPYFGNSAGINCLVADAANNIYAAGWFQNANGAAYVAKWDGVKWSELGGVNTSPFTGTVARAKIGRAHV